MSVIKKETHQRVVSWHTLSVEDVYGVMNSSESGLSEDEVLKRRKESGWNTLPSRKSVPVIVIFMKQFLSPLIYVLIIAGIASIFIGDKKDAMFIFAVIMINAIIGMIQEWKAEKSAAALQNLIKVKTIARRDGFNREIVSDELVPGDIVSLESGSKIPADMRIIGASGLEIDESLLTGESLAVEKNKDAVPEEMRISERYCMAYAGSVVTKGRGKGIVVATGLTTEVGRIADTVIRSKGAKPPLLIRMEKFTFQVSIFVLLCSAAVAAVLLLNGQPFKSVFFAAVALAVSAIPEGLPVALTVALSIAAQRMAKRNVIVRKLTAVESLGSCTYIASDKTGTLTVNQQTVRSVFIPQMGTLKVTGEGYNHNGHVVDETGNNLRAQEGSALWKLVRAGVLCNEGSMTMIDEKWVYYGDAMDIALLALAYKAGHDPKAIADRYPEEGEIPYESENKYAARFFSKEGEIYIAVKGAVETVMSFCTSMQTEKGTVPLDKVMIESEYYSMAEEGYRVLAVAEGNTNGLKDEKGLKNLVLLGLVGFLDPLRPEAVGAVEKCKMAGIEVAMVTGDHPITAFVIARELGICSSKEEVMTGKQLEDLGGIENDEFKNAVLRSRVFARVTPIQKLQIVDTLIRSGHYVAVTGDGVNDAPALKRANIGVAMGSGTDVAKDTGVMLVTDDNFASIVGGVEEGRFAFSNVRKVIYLLISTGAAEIALFVLSLVFTGKFFNGRLELPLLPLQLLWLNLVTNGLQDVGLAFEQGEPGEMTKPPRKPSEGIFNKLMIQETLLSGTIMALTAFGLWYFLLFTGMEIIQARNMTLLLMVILENIHVFNCRSERVSAFRMPLKRNVFVVMSVIAAQGIHILCMNIPFMQNLLDIRPVEPGQWLIVFVLALGLLITMEIFKLIKKKVDAVNDK